MEFPPSEQVEQQSQLIFDKPSRPFLTVSQVTTKIKGLLEGEVGEVWIKGEISSLKPAASGHLYFSLKDSGALLSCAMFRANNRVKFELKDGVEVLAHGKVSVYAPRGNYQLIVDHMEPVGAGALQLAFEQLKKKLLGEGLFDAAKRRPIPAHPTRIAIVTSPTGAALQDMLNVLGRRNAGISVVVIPTLVQGNDAPAQIVRAIEIVNRYQMADVLVVARGGGSMEDLWCFNDENVVRAIRASLIPTISAIGHEVDFTLSDFAADLRAPTPSAAAELVSKSRLELLEVLQLNSRRLALTMHGQVSRRKAQLLLLETKLVSPAERVARNRNTLAELELRMLHLIDGKIPVYRQMTDEIHSKMLRVTDARFSQRKREFEVLAGRLEALSPLKVLGRGYTLVQDQATGELVKSIQQAQSGKEVALVFQDGKSKARIL